jgi:phage tail P2-like protein
MPPPVPTLLPNSSTPLERAASIATGRFAPAVVVPDLWDAATCPVPMLPHLAWALAVDDWDATWGEERKRTAIANALYIHRHKGTPAAIRRALAIVEQGDATLIERADYKHHDGEITRTGLYHRGGAAHWATYAVVLKRAITIDQSVAIIAALRRVVRNCVHLLALDFREVAIRHNGATLRAGIYTRGIIN